ncbi:Crp/Fnr family transcriptional regulator [Aquimarina agarilytica]|uniref:Crp/Fnr family transcriptional regulator n=1 Tax=Aquimarina agarilytica TaxID=1087449 RepID=UPI000492A643|nr:Crp/Fnr family transcriptional regulator [Aquimarina agarilytica]
MIDELEKQYSYIFEKELLLEISKIGVLKEVPEAFELIRAGQFVKSMPLLLNGVIKILRNDNDGEELLLYFLEKGDTCAMTLTCCLGETRSEIKAISETPTKLIMIPIEKMDSWLIKYKSWRNFVLNSYQNRFMEMLDAIDSIAFNKMDERLEKYLKNRAKVIDNNILFCTHQEIAFDLHSSRVVISRLLKSLENQGKIKISRNSIELL